MSLVICQFVLLMTETVTIKMIKNYLSDAVNLEIVKSISVLEAVLECQAECAFFLILGGSLLTEFKPYNSNLWFLKLPSLNVFCGHIGEGVGKETKKQAFF